MTASEPLSVTNEKPSTGMMFLNISYQEKTLPPAFRDVVLLKNC